MKKKLIEVALPLEAINREAAREKGNPFLKGHPRTLHQWWARRPLAICRAVLFSSLVDDPSSHINRFPTLQAQEKERNRLFGIIERLVKWENSNDPHILKEARTEIMLSNDGCPPAIYDPFCGGGSIPVEAQRLGLESYASDLNPVAVMMTKALTEIPSKFRDCPPINPKENTIPIKGGWRGAQGLASDVRYYSAWLTDKAEGLLKQFYPTVTLPKKYGEAEARVVAWIWARTVKCPNPACGAKMPLVKTFWLSTKKGKEAWIEPIIDRVNKSVSYQVRTGEGEPPPTSKLARGAKFKCFCCDQAAPEEHIKSEGCAGRMGVDLMAIVAEGTRSKIYLAPNELHCKVVNFAKPEGVVEEELPFDPRNIWCTKYGLKCYSDLFTSRQLLTLSTFSSLVAEAYLKIKSDALAVGMVDDDTLENGGTGATAYAESIAVYLAMIVDKCVDYGNSLCTWNPGNQNVTHLFTKQAIPMSWDFCEGNLLGHGLSPAAFGEGVAASIAKFELVDGAKAFQRNICDEWVPPSKSIVYSTDPPYYDNISYGNLSDFFYVWLRRSLRDVFKSGLFSTLLVPKSEELIVSPDRFDGKLELAANFFEKGLGNAFARMRETQDPRFPTTVYYAFKQSEQDESDDDGNETVVSTGWEKMLEGLIEAGFTINGTLPMRTERSARSVAMGSNALASSIILVCRQRPSSAEMITRREFIGLLKAELATALATLKHSNIAATDLAQAAIGPGMAVFSRYSKVMEADGSTMKVRTALALINQVLDEVNSESEGDFDPDSRWAVTWFETHGFEEGLYGEAETLSKAKNTSTTGLVEAGVITSKAGKVKLIPIESLPENWNPKSDTRLTVWEATHHLIRVLETKGEEGAATLLKDMGAFGEVARDLAYRLYSICERKKWAKDALRYNGLVVAWSDVTKRSAEVKRTDRPIQESFF